MLQSIFALGYIGLILSHILLRFFKYWMYVHVCSLAVLVSDWYTIYVTTSTFCWTVPCRAVLQLNTCYCWSQHDGKPQPKVDPKWGLNPWCWVFPDTGTAVCFPARLNIVGWSPIRPDIDLWLCIRPVPADHDPVWSISLVNVFLIVIQ